jgi:hypothetical protein
MQQHGVTKTELEQYLNALVSSSAQQAAAMDTMPHADMLELTMESLTNGLVLNSNQQAHEVPPLLLALLSFFLSFFVQRLLGAARRCPLRCLDEQHSVLSQMHCSSCGPQPVGCV